MEEIWKPIPNIPDYAVSNLGNFVRITDGKGTQSGKPRKTYVNPVTGYRNVTFGNNSKRDGKTTRTYSAHRLVAETWIPNPENLATVDHINGDRGDNRVENLRWCSYRDNSQRAASKPTKIIHLKTGQEKTFDTRKECAQFLGITVNYLTRAILADKPIAYWEIIPLDKKR